MTGILFQSIRMQRPTVPVRESVIRFAKGLTRHCKYMSVILQEIDGLSRELYETRVNSQQYPD